MRAGPPAAARGAANTLQGGDTMARKERALLFLKIAAAGVLLLLALAPLAPAGQGGAAAPNDPIAANAGRMVDEGRQTFRYDTFGDQVFWSRILGIHQALKTVSPHTALAVGLKVDSDALPPGLLAHANLDDPAVTAELLRRNAVVGVRGFFNQDGTLRAAGITCALCHSTVDDSVAPGVGKRLDGWPNRDLNVGAVVNLAPNLQPVATLLGVDEPTVRTVLQSWGPGRFDAELFLDGKAFRRDGKTAATLIPPAFGLAGVDGHTFTGWGSVTYWNAFVANLEMHGQGRFWDPRLNDPVKFPIAARNGCGDVRSDHDFITPKLASLQLYQLPPPPPPPPPRPPPPRRRRRPAASTRRRRDAARPSSPRRAAPLATCRPSTPSRAGTATRPRRSASTPSRPTARRTATTAPRRSRGSGRTARGATITTAASPPCATSSITTTGTSGCT